MEGNPAGFGKSEATGDGDGDGDEVEGDVYTTGGS